MSETERLLGAIREAQAAGRISIDVDVKAVSRKGSPSFRTTDIVVPWFFALVVSAYVGVAYGAVTGAALFIVAAALVVLLLRPFNRRRTIERTIAMALAKPEHWETLWQMGGLALARRDGSAASCAAPDGDWQGFARGLAGPMVGQAASGS